MELNYIQAYRMRNMTHFEFHMEILALIDKEGAVKLGIAPLRANYGQAFTSWDILLKKIIKSKYTKLMKQTDHERDQKYTAIKDLINVALVHHSPEVRDAGERLKILTNTYGNINTKPYHEQSAAVYNIVQEFNGAYKNDIALIRAKDVVDQLQEANYTFKQYVDARDAENENKPKGDAVAVRKVVDDIYYDINETIAAQIKLNGLGELGPYISMHNVITDRYKKMMKQAKPHPKTPEDKEADTANKLQIRSINEEIKSELATIAEHREIVNKHLAIISEHRKHIKELRAEIESVKEK